VSDALLMRVALDLEEVLADTISEACRSSPNLDPEHFDEWNISNHTWQVYAGVSDALWRHDPLSIPPMEPNLNYHIGQVHDSVDVLDIVTARLHVDGQVANWLDHHNVPYDEIVSTDSPKYELDYDIFVDDNPEMIGECRLLLRTQDHNRQQDVGGVKSCDRIDSVAEVSDFV
jgi:hypothetical protein